MPPERESLRSLIGGRWAVSWQGYLLAWPWAVLFIFSTSPTVWDSGTLAERISRGVLVGTLTYIPVGIVMWLASLSVFRNCRTIPVPIALVALIGGLAWTTRSLSMIGYLEIADLPSDASPLLRLVAGFIQGALAFVLTAWLLAKLTAFHEQRRRLLDTLVQDEIENEQLHDRVQQLKSHVIDQVRRSVDERAQSIATESWSRTPTLEDVEMLSNVTKQISKQLARDLWVDTAKSAKVNPLTVVRSTVVNRPFTYWALLPGLFLGILALPIYWSLQYAMITVSAVTLFAFVISLIANFACPRSRPSWAFVIYIASILLLLSSAFLMNIMIEFFELNPTGGGGLLWAVAVNFGIFFPLVGAGAHIGRAQQDVLVQLRRSISQAEIERHALNLEEAQLRRDLAVSLHGGLQADLTATTLRTQQAIDVGDADAARRALSDARTLIKQGWELPELTDTDLRNTTHAVVTAWEGFADITLTIDVNHEPDSRRVNQVKEVLLEGIGNAVRHGRAKNITINIDDLEGDFRIVITDDGTGVTGSRIGLGSAMFNDIAPNTWSLTPTSTGGSTLTVALPTTEKI